jgi:hypothetical protein
MSGYKSPVSPTISLFYVFLLLSFLSNFLVLPFFIPSSSFFFLFIYYSSFLSSTFFLFFFFLSSLHSYLAPSFRFAYFLYHYCPLLKLIYVISFSIHSYFYPCFLIPLVSSFFVFLRSFLIYLSSFHLSFLPLIFASFVLFCFCIPSLFKRFLPFA